ncbi:MAG: hypothetical protein J5892_01430 [Bacilli bacterium]|nr:hypothetical protein [Bacilli bacterium]
MKKYSISSNNEKVQNSVNNCTEKIEEILDFFNIDNVNVTIKVLSYDAFKKEFKDYLNYDSNDCTAGFIEDDKNMIVVLDYDDYKYTNHHSKTYDDFIKTVIHEFVHVVHSIACKHRYPSDELWEGIAVYLSNQYDFEAKIGSGSYYEYGLNIYNYLKEHDKESLLSILNVDN